MTLITNGQHGGAIELVAFVVVEESVGLLVPGVVHVVQTDVPGDIESKLALVVDVKEQTGRQLESHLQTAVVVIDAVAKGDRIVFFLDLVGTKEFSYLIDLATQTDIEGGPHGQGYPNAAVELLAIAYQKRNREKMQSFVGREETGAFDVLEIIGFVMTAFLHVLQTAGQGESSDLETGDEASVYPGQGTGGGIQFSEVNGVLELREICTAVSADEERTILCVERGESEGQQNEKSCQLFHNLDCFKKLMNSGVTGTGAIPPGTIIGFLEGMG